MQKKGLCLFKAGMGGTDFCKSRENCQNKLNEAYESGNGFNNDNNDDSDNKY